MSETIKFTKEELDQISKLRTENQQKVTEFGQIELELLLTEQRTTMLFENKKKLAEAYEDLQKKEIELVQTLNEKYGAGTVDIASGEFIPAK